MVDIKVAISGLISIFKIKLYSMCPSSAVFAFKALITHLNAHYSDSFIEKTNSCTKIRQQSSAIKLEVRDETSVIYS